MIEGVSIGEGEEEGITTGGIGFWLPPIQSDADGVEVRCPSCGCVDAKHVATFCAHQDYWGERGQISQNIHRPSFKCAGCGVAWTAEPKQAARSYDELCDERDQWEAEHPVQVAAYRKACEEALQRVFAERAARHEEGE